MQDLTKSTIFLHGPSGSGKGELQRKLTQKYSSEGYGVRYISSGDLYRDAFARPEIARAMKQGIYFDTLGAIIPGLQDAYADYLQQLLDTGGKTVLILDGLIRRGKFVNKEGVVIPSQIEQVASAFYEVRSTFPELSLADNQVAIGEVVNSQHLLIDINPRDAEAQMKIRANKELVGIREQVSQRYFRASLSDQMNLLIEGLTEITNADVATNEEFEYISQEVMKIKQEIALTTGMESSGSFSSFFQEFGISTQLRDDDVSPVARRKRIENYVTVKHTWRGDSYEPGFAAQALVEDVGYQFKGDGSFASKRDNSLVIANGGSRGVELQTFQRECGWVSEQLYAQTAGMQEGKLWGREGGRRGKER